MIVYDVIQRILPDCASSYPKGVNWIASFDSEQDANKFAEKFNTHVDARIKGILYDVAGPFEETEEREYQ